MINRKFLVVGLIGGVALAAGPAALAQHQVEVTELTVTQDGRAVREVPVGSRVTIECGYRVAIDRGFPPRPGLPDWSGDLSVDGRTVRAFNGERRTGQEVVSAEWVAESSGSVAILCRLDRRGAFRDVEGNRTREMRLRVEREVGAVVQCQEGLTATVGLGSTTRTRGTRAGQASLELSLARSQADGDAAVCYYESRNRDIRDFRVEIDCRNARRSGASSGSTRQTDPRANDAGRQQHRYLCGAG